MKNILKQVQTLQTDILLRFMKPSEFEALLEEYKKNRKRIRASAPVKKDYDIAMFQNKFGTQATMKKFGVSQQIVYGSIDRVSKYEWRKMVDSTNN